MLAKSTRQEQKEKTRLKLIRTSADLFTKNGIANTATANIAKTLRVSHGTLFIHFPTREDLILAVIDDFGARLSDELRGSVLRESSLAGVLRSHLRALAAFEDLYFRLLSEINTLPEKVRSTVFMLNAAVSWKLYEAAAPLMKSGRVKKINRPLLFNTWMGLVSYYIVHRDQLSEKTPVLQAKGEELLRHFLGLIET